MRKVRASQPKHCGSAPHGHRVLSTPAHDFVELLSSQEARVLPDLPQSALKLLLVFVLQSFLLSFLSGAAPLLTVVQAEECETKTSNRCNTGKGHVYPSLRSEWLMVKDPA